MKRALLLAVILTCACLALWWLAVERESSPRFGSSSSAGDAHDATLELDAAEVAATQTRAQPTAAAPATLRIRIIDRRGSQPIEGATISLPVFQSFRNPSPTLVVNATVLWLEAGLGPGIGRPWAGELATGEILGRSDGEGVVELSVEPPPNRGLLIRHAGHCSTLVYVRPAPSSTVDVTLAPSGRARVRTRDASGAPRSGVSIVLSASDPPAPSAQVETQRDCFVLGLEKSLTTNSLGELIVDALPVERELYFAAMTGARSRWVHGLIRPEVGVVDIDVLVSDVGAVRGALARPAGEPVVNSRLVLRSSNVPAESYATTDEAGRFEFADIPVGRSYLMFGERDPPGMWVDVEAGRTTDVGTLVVRARVELSGTVTSSTRLCWGGIQILAIEDERTVGGTTTDEGGTFHLNVAPGPKLLLALQDSVEIGRLETSAPGKVELPVTGAGASIRAKLEPVPTEAVPRAVFVPLEGPHPLSRPWCILREMTLSPEGELHVCRTPRGLHAVVLLGDGGRGACVPRVELADGGIDLGAVRFGTGALRLSIEGEVAVDAPLRVSLDAVAGATGREVLVGAEGLVVEGLAPGPWIVSARVAQGVVRTRPVFVDVDSQAAARLEIRRGALVEGRVLRGTVPASEDVRLSERPDGTNQVVPSDVDGWYHAARVSAGTYVLGVAGQWRNLSLRDGDVVRQDFDVSEGGTTLRFLHAGRAMSLTTVYAISLDALRAGRWEFEIVMTQDGTSASFHRLEGDQWLRVLAPSESKGYGYWAAVAHVPPGTKEMVVSVPERELVLEGALLEAWRTPPEVRVPRLPGGLQEPEFFGGVTLPFLRSEDGTIHVLSIPDDCGLEITGIGASGERLVKRVESTSGGGTLRVAWP